MQLRPLFPFLGSSLRNGSRAFAALILGLSIPLLGAGPVPAGVEVTVTGLRSSQGVVLACVSAAPERFPDCREQAGDYRLEVPAGQEVTINFADVRLGRYAIALLHDDNGKADRRCCMVPKEGFGFSRDAPARLGPPEFDSAAFEVRGRQVHQTIRMWYLP